MKIEKADFDKISAMIDALCNYAAALQERFLIPSEKYYMDMAASIYVQVKLFSIGGNKGWTLVLSRGDLPDQELTAAPIAIKVQFLENVEAFFRAYAQEAMNLKEIIDHQLKLHKDPDGVVAACARQVRIVTGEAP